MSGLSAGGYTLLGLTAVVAVLVAVLAYAAMRFAAAASDARRHLGAGQEEQALLSSTLSEAICRLRAQERAMAARADASERLSSEIVEGITSGLLVVERGGDARIVNPAARRILKLDAASQAGASWLAGRPDLAPLGAIIDRTLETGVPASRQTVPLDAGHGPFYLGVTVSPLRDRDGAVHAAICLFTDLTEAMALEEHLRLKEALARLGELTAGLAHEFRNGLATIRGYGQLLNPQVFAEPERTYVEGIQSETESLGRLVSQFLAFARPEPLALAPVDLGAAVRAAVDDAAGGGGVEVSGYFGCVDGSEVLLRQAVGNLVRNAIEACDGTGRAVKVGVHGEVDAESHLVSIAIADEGPGIAAHVLDRVFRPFFTTRSTGTGLGLAIVQKVIVGHNGRVTAANRPGGGAVFTITLPCLPAGAPPRKA